MFLCSAGFYLLAEVLITCLRLRSAGFYLLLAGLRVVLSVLGLSQQVGEGQWFEGPGARGSGIPERVRHPQVPPTSHRAEGARAHPARRVDAVDADHCGEPARRRAQRNREGTSGVFNSAGTFPVSWNFRVFVGKQKQNPGIQTRKTWKKRRRQKRGKVSTGRGSSSICPKMRLFLWLLFHETVYSRERQMREKRRFPDLNDQQHAERKSKTKLFTDTRAQISLKY